MGKSFLRIVLIGGQIFTAPGAPRDGPGGPLGTSTGPIPSHPCTLARKRKRDFPAYGEVFYFIYIKCGNEFTAFIGEQPNPWELLHPQDAMHIIPRFHGYRLYHHLAFTHR